MKYYLIAGEASGDLHASELMRALKERDPHAEFRYYGGDKMQAVGGTLVRHYKDIAYMGFIPGLLQLTTRLKSRKQCKRDILRWQPDKIILIDYAGFNLNIARWAKKQVAGGRWQVAYYIVPKLWGWKEGRIKYFNRYIDQALCILPFEKRWFKTKHGLNVEYVGNPTAEEVRKWQAGYTESAEDFKARHNLDSRPILALLPGSRKQEIKDNLSMMLKVANNFPEYQPVIAHVGGETYELLSHSTAALVCSGTATLETCCIGTPQVVLYKTPLPKVSRWVWDHLFKVPYISLPNLIANQEVVREMMAERFTEDQISTALTAILPGGEERQKVLQGYEAIKRELGTNSTARQAALLIFDN